MILEESIRLTFTYAAGSVGSRFLAALRDSRMILGSHCPGCGAVSCPARFCCPRCGARTGSLVEVGPSGTLQAWTAMPGTGMFGLIRLDGADTAVVHRLLGGDDGWERDARVTARFAEERVGSIDDIEGFEREREEP